VSAPLLAAAEADLSITGWGWLRLAIGIAVLLLPGLALADRLFPAKRSALLLAPVFSLSVLPLAVIILDFMFAVPVSPSATALLAVGLAALFAAPRLAPMLTSQDAYARVKAASNENAIPDSAATGAGAWVRSPASGATISVSSTVRSRRTLALVVLAIGLAAAWVHYIPHFPAESGADLSRSPLDAYPTLLARTLAPDSPYPVHVDEHVHHALTAEIARTGKLAISDPYTGQPYAEGLFTVSGFRQERGFDLAILQVSDVTGASVPTLQRFLPALWSGLLAVALYLVLRPAPGALAAAALTAMLPSTLRFLGVAFLIPSNFGLIWILATLFVALQADGARRFIGLLLLITAAHFMHLVIGVLCIVTGILATLMRPGHLGDRAALAAATLLPLAWIVPASYNDLSGAIRMENVLPFELELFGQPGLLFYAAALIGAVIVTLDPRRDTLPHRILLALATILTVLMAGSVVLDHHSDATYGRLVHAFFLCLCALAGLSLGHLGRWLAAAASRLAARRQATSGDSAMPVAAPTEDAVTPAARAADAASTPPHAGVTAAVVAFLLLAVLATPLHHHLNEPYYRVWDDEGWASLHAFAAAEVQPGDVFLSHPWRAPTLNAVSGATPHAVLYPGAEPVNEADYVHYVTSRGADAAWLRERGIDWVISATPPNAANQTIGPGVYRLL
jgi:hypothetical protein